MGANWSSGFEKIYSLITNSHPHNEQKHQQCVQDDSGHPRVGIVILDSADIQLLKWDGTLQSVVTHEIVSRHC